jgi:hypothetical protein
VSPLWLKIEDCFRAVFDDSLRGLATVVRCFHCIAQESIVNESANRQCMMELESHDKEISRQANQVATPIREGIYRFVAVGGCWRPANKDTNQI